MFKSFSYLKYEIENKKEIFEFIDDEFGFVIISFDIGSDFAARETYFIIQEYEKRNMSVAKNIALYYTSKTSSLKRARAWATNDANWLSTNHPELGYEKYYIEIERQFEILMLLG